jgi:hypothetical protein
MLARLIGLTAAALFMLLAAPAAAQTACDPMQTQARFRGQVPKLQDVVPNPGGENGEVTTDQAYAYMDAVGTSTRSPPGCRARWSAPA